MLYSYKYKYCLYLYYIIYSIYYILNIICTYDEHKYDNYKYLMCFSHEHLIKCTSLILYFLLAITPFTIFCDL